ncbi:polymorphic toxin-type HINT domain-containing protein, partial [Spirillospora sp. NPDC048819]|uniref:golvesin C-terminal-like domain-containing protein n=1 Tax=Spirillospora sp. NPDC048819 TaxID=3155268 RepID=UPI0033E9459B
TTKLGWDDDNNVTRLEEPPATTGATPAVSTWAYEPNTGYPTEIKDAEAVKNGWSGTTLTYQTGLGGHIADLISKQSPEGRTSTFGYTPEGNLSSVTDPLGNATSTEGDYTTTYTYDTWGQLKTATDANGHTTTNSDFGPTGYPKAITDALDKTTTFVYDERGQVTKVTDPLGHFTTQGYDTYGRPLQKTVPKDQDAGDLIITPAPEYDRNDNVIETTAPNGAVTTAVYDATDQVTDIVEPTDETGDPERRSTYTYDKAGHLKTATEPKGSLSATEGDYTVTNHYDEIYQLVRTVNPRGGTITNSYDGAGNLVKVVDPNKSATADTGDFTAKYAYDLNHRRTVTTDAAGETTSTAYDRDGLPIEAVDQEGNKTLTEFDARGKPRQVQVPHETDDGALVHRTTRYEYDQAGNRTKVITPRGVATTAADDFTYQTVYDELNRVKEEWAAYDPSDSRYNQPNKTLFEYDAAGRRTTVSAPPSEGQSIRNDTRYTYFDNGWTHTSTDPWDISTEYDYNALGQQISNTLTSAGGSTTRTMLWDYYPSGNLKARSDSGVPVGSQVVLVDNSDYNNTAENPSGAWTAGTAGQQYGYNVHIRPAGDGSGLFVWQLTIPRDGDYEVFVRHPGLSDGAPDARFSVAHSGGEATQTVDQTTGAGEWKSLGTYAFTENGPHKLTLTDQATAGTTLAADAVKLVRDNSGDTDNERKDFTYRYDPNGNVVKVADNSPSAAVNVYATTYDDLNRITQVEEKTGTSVKNTTAYTYDANGNPLTRTHDDTWSGADYDARNQVTKITNADSATASAQRVSTFTYTARGQLATQIKPNGNTVNFDYTLDGLIAQQTETKSGGATIAQHTLDYTPNGDIRQDLAKLQSADDPGTLLETTYDLTYDPQDRITQLAKTGQAAGTETYVYDANNNVVTQTVGGTTTIHHYDRNRLLTSTANGITSTYNYDPLGRLDTVSTGGQISQRYRYDGFDRTISHTSGIGTAAKTTAYTYDPFDRTTSKTKNGKTTGFAYLGLTDSVLTETAAGQLSKSYEYSAMDGRLTQLKHDTGAAPEISQYTYHPRGDVEAITKPNGDTRATYGYTAYGDNDDPKFTGVDKPDLTNPDAEPYNSYRFNGHRWDQSSGTYDMGFRNYDPGLNRFLTRDTYGGALDDMGLATDPFTMNRYAFAGGNPISFVDLDGHNPCTPAQAYMNACGGDPRYALPYAEQKVREDPIPSPTFGESLKSNASFLWGVFGFQSTVDCASGGDSCGWAALEILPFGLGKIFKALGKAARAGKAAKAGSGGGGKAGGKGSGGTSRGARPRTVKGPSAPHKAQCPAPSSFVPGTAVLMADRSSKAIEDVKMGDRVMATDPETGDTRPRTVIDTINSQGDKQLMTLTVDVDGEHGTKTAKIIATEEHPFWLPDYGRWANAEDLKPGMWLRTSTGTWTQITAAQTHTRHQRVHNLTIADAHTYYVLAGSTSVLVHNSCGPSLRQAIGSIRNKANDTYLGRLLMRRPMEPWRSNRRLHRALGGAAPEPNATIQDLAALVPGNPSISYKAANAVTRSDDDLMASVFNPRDGQYIATYTGRPGVIGQGNHRAMELLRRAADPNNDNIRWNTKIFVHRVGE